MTDAPAPSRLSDLPRPLSERFKPMKVALIIYLIGELGLAGVNAAEWYVLTTMGIDPYLEEGPLLAVFGLSALVVSLLQLGGLILSVILVSMWTFRAMKNLHLVGEREAIMSPGWAVGWHFIPIANLWKPFEGMSQIWRGSHAQAGKPNTIAAYVGWWWVAWIGSNILANVSLRLTGFMEPEPTYEIGLLVSVVASLVSVVCAVLLIRVGKQVTAVQAEMKRGGVADTFR